MAGRRAIAIRPVSRTQIPTVEDSTVQRALELVSSDIQDLQDKRNRDVLTFNLLIGTNRVPHGLGRPVTGFTVTATIASASFAHAINTSNTRPDLEVWIDVVGLDMPNAIIEVF